jgi:Zn-dependent peptidase ImmA (M78 family)
VTLGLSDYEQLELVAQAARDRAGLSPIDPIPEIVGVLEQLGLQVLVRALGPTGPQGIYVRRSRFAAVLLNGSDYLPRFRFTGAHELGHHERAHYDVHVDLDLAGRDRKEQEANAFAASFLAPRRALFERIGRLPKRRLSPEQVLQLAADFIVSYEFMVNRLHNVGLLQGAQHRDELKAARETVLTDELREMRPAERWRMPADFIGRALTAYGRYEISLGRLAELLQRETKHMASVLAAHDYLHPEDAAP